MLNAEVTRPRDAAVTFGANARISTAMAARCSTATSDPTAKRARTRVLGSSRTISVQSIGTLKLFTAVLIVDQTVQ